MATRKPPLSSEDRQHQAQLKAVRADIKSVQFRELIDFLSDPFFSNGDVAFKKHKAYDAINGARNDLVDLLLDRKDDKPGSDQTGKSSIASHIRVSLPGIVNGLRSADKRSSLRGLMRDVKGKYDEYLQAVPRLKELYRAKLEEDEETFKKGKRHQGWLKERAEIAAYELSDSMLMALIDFCRLYRIFLTTLASAVMEQGTLSGERSLRVSISREKDMRRKLSENRASMVRFHSAREPEILAMLASSEPNSKEFDNLSLMLGETKEIIALLDGALLGGQFVSADVVARIDDLDRRLNNPRGVYKIDESLIERLDTIDEFSKGREEGITARREFAGKVFDHIGISKNISLGGLFRLTKFVAKTPAHLVKAGRSVSRGIRSLMSVKRGFRGEVSDRVIRPIKSVGGFVKSLGRASVTNKHKNFDGILGDSAFEIDLGRGDVNLPVGSSGSVAMPAPSLDNSFSPEPVYTENPSSTTPAGSPSTSPTPSSTPPGQVDPSLDGQPTHTVPPVSVSQSSPSSPSSTYAAPASAASDTFVDSSAPVPESATNSVSVDGVNAKLDHISAQVSSGFGRVFSLLSKRGVSRPSRTRGAGSSSKGGKNKFRSGFSLSDEELADKETEGDLFKQQVDHLKEISTLLKDLNDHIKNGDKSSSSSVIGKLGDLGNSLKDILLGASAGGIGALILKRFPWLAKLGNVLRVIGSFGSRVMPALGRGLLTLLTTGLGAVIRNAGSLLRGGLVAAGAYAADSILGLFGVGKNLDTESIQKADDKNWAEMDLGDKVGSAAFRGIEKVGKFLGMDNVAAEAQKSRVEGESAALQSRRMSSSTPAVPMTNAEVSTETNSLASRHPAPSTGVSGGATGSEPASTPASPSSSVSTGSMQDPGNSGYSLRGNANMEGLDSGFRGRFNRAVAEYKAQGGKHKVTVNRAFATREQQAEIFKKYGPGRAAPPGSSVHEYGFAIDIDSQAANDMDRMGILAKNGISRPIAGEPWHLQQSGMTSKLAKSGIYSSDSAKAQSPGATTTASASSEAAPAIAQNAEGGPTGSTSVKTNSGPSFNEAVYDPKSSTKTASSSDSTQQYQNKNRNVVGSSPSGNSVETVPTFSFLDPGLFVLNVNALA